MITASESKVKKLEDEIARARSPKQRCSLLIDLAMELRYSHPALSLQEAQKALLISEEINFIVGKARSHFCSGLVYFNQSDYEKAFVFLDRAYHYFLEASDKWGVSNALNHIGLIYLRLGDYSKALENFSSSLEIKKESNDRFGTANVMISIATIQRETGNAAEARVLLTESLKISEELKSDVIAGRALMELGIVLLMESKFSEAAEKFYEARSLFEKQDNPPGIAQCFLHLGKIKSASGDSGYAVTLFEEGQKIAAETGDKSLMTLFMSNIAAEKFRSGETSEAISLLLEAREVALKTQEKPLLAGISQQLSEVYEATGELADALHEFKNFISLKDEINSVETATRLRNLQISAKLEVLEKENKMLELERLLAVENVRTRLSRDLHDEIGSGLTKITLMAQRIKMNLEGNRSIDPSLLDKITESSKQIVGDLAEIIWTVNPKQDNLNSLLSYFRNYIAQFLEDTSVGCVIDFPEISAEGSGIGDITIHPDLKRNLFLVLKESLNNIVKHANAHQVTIGFTFQQKHFHFEIRDDGIGMKDLSGREFGNGLMNMKQRIESVNGKFEMQTTPGSGTVIVIEGDLSY